MLTKWLPTFVTLCLPPCSHRKNWCLQKRTLDICNFERLCALGEPLTCGLGDAVRSPSPDVRSSAVKKKKWTTGNGWSQNRLLTSLTRVFSLRLVFPAKSSCKDLISPFLLPPETGGHKTDPWCPEEKWTFLQTLDLRNSHSFCLLSEEEQMDHLKRVVTKQTLDVWDSCPLILLMSELDRRC
jgi:hypothetical protein